MKKPIRFLFLLITLLAAYKPFAQPVLTAQTSTPGYGSQAKYFKFDLYTAGPSGANVVWDYSGIAQHPDTTSYTYVGCGSVNNCGTFPGTTLIRQRSTEYQYTIADSVKQVHLGSYYPMSNSSITYTDPMETFHFPFTYNTSFSDSFYYHFGTTYTKGKITVSCSAYGTLILPNDTFTNVLRVTSVKDYIDSSTVSQSLSYRSIVNTWYSMDKQVPLLIFDILDYNELAGSFVTSYLLDTNPVGIADINTIEASLKISPNPASDFLNITFDCEQRTTLSIALYDLTGRQLSHTTGQFAKGTNSQRIDVASLPGGIYLLHISGAGQTTTRKITVQ